MKSLLKYFLLAYFLLVIQSMGWSQGSCLNFDGVDDYVEVPNTALNNIGFNNFTFEAWIQGDLANQPAHPTIFSNRPGSGNGIIFFFHDLWGGSAHKMLCLEINQNANHLILNNGTFNGNLLDGTCHHVAVARENDSLLFYADGSLLGTVAIFNSTPTVSSSANLWIGRDGPTNNAFNGIISQVRIWDVARSASEIFSNMNVSLPGSTPGLSAYWELDDANGQLVVDKTTNYNGQLGSSAVGDANDPQWFSNCCSITTGISETETQGIELILSPNPNNGRFVIDLASENLAAIGIKVRVFDSGGKVIFKDHITVDNNSVDISNHPAGIYLIQIITSQVSVSRKFIKY